MLLWASVVIGLAIVLALLAGVGGYVGWRIATRPDPNARDMTGLEGVWRDEDSPKHLYRFRKDGTLENSWGGLPFGSFGTWEREGDKVTVQTIRDWDFEAELKGKELRGQVMMRSSGIASDAKVWKHEWPAD
jgi:hypothetical protein